MTDGNALEQVYQEDLEEQIIRYLAEKMKTSYKNAMRLYYRSSMATQISGGENGIQYLDYKVLVQVLCETELNKEK